MLPSRRFDQLQAVDVEGVPPALRADVDGANQLREDIPRVYENRCSVQQQVLEISTWTSMQSCIDLKHADCCL